MYLFLAALLAFVIAQYDPDSQPMEFPPSPFLPKELIPRYETPLNQKELSFYWDYKHLNSSRCNELNKVIVLQY